MRPIRSRLLAIGAAAVLALTAVSALSQSRTAAEPSFAKVGRKALGTPEPSLRSSWGKLSPEWAARLDQDETMAICSALHNKPPDEVGEAIRLRERAKIKYPEDRNLSGDWRSGERIAKSGYGMRFTDDPPTQPNGGNCFACHQLDKTEVSHGTLGPSLAGYGKLHAGGQAAIEAVYDRIYNPQAVLACARMPRLGVHGVLTMEQIKDLVAYVMSPESPVNK